MKTHLVLLFLLFGLAGCVIGPIQPQASFEQIQNALKFEANDQYSNVYLSRVDMFIYSGVAIEFVIDNKSLGFLDTGGYFNVQLGPGKHVIEVKDQNLGNLKFEFMAKQKDVAMIRCEANHLSGVETRDFLGVTSSRLMGCWQEPLNRNLIAASTLRASRIGRIEGSRDIPAYQEATRVNTVVAYKIFIEKYPQSPHAPKAEKQLSKLFAEQTLVTMREIERTQKCRLKHQDWLYVGSACNDGYANGNGRAVSKDGVQSFSGRIVKGKFVSGLYTIEGNKEYDGLFKNGLPDGEGICFYRGKPEECKYYQGYRVDTLYKQREEMVAFKQQQQKEMAALKSQMQKANAQPRVINAGAPTAGDQLQQEVIKQGVGMLLDQLF